jgi:hypothetical protein
VRLRDFLEAAGEPLVFLLVAGTAVFVLWRVFGFVEAVAR